MRAEPATDLALADDFGFRKIADALDATDFGVCPVFFFSIVFGLRMSALSGQVATVDCLTL